MEITKNGKTFHIEEKSDKWSVRREIDGVKVSYEISKKDCGSLEEVKEYIISNNVF